MINYLKNGNINIKIDVNQKDVLKTNLEFWSHDLKSGLLTIKYTNLGEPVPLVCESTVRLIMRFTENDENKHRIETMTVTDKVNGVATLEIPDEILGYEGIVECGTYIDFKNGQTLDAGYFTFRMRKSMIDGEFKELDTIYVKEFSDALEKIKQQIIDYEREHATLIGNSTREFNEFLTTSEKKVDDMLNSDVKLDTTIFRDYERNNNHYVSQLHSKLGEVDNLANSLNNEMGTVVEKVGTLPTQSDLHALKSIATVTENGLMSAADKVKLDSFKEVDYSNRLIKKDVFPHFVMHRGYNLGTNIYPENSLQSFEASYQNYGCETDIRATKDGKFVCMHDATINRTTTGTGAVSELTLAQIKSFKLKTPLTLNSIYASQLVPTFEEFLAVMQKNGTVPFIEIKALGSAANYDAFCQVISSAGADNYGYVISFDYSALQEVRLRLPEMRLQFLSGTLDDSVINQILELGRCDADISINGLTQEKVKKAHSYGIAVNAYTINSLDSIQKATAYGVDFITSDISQANDRMWEAAPANATNVNSSYRIGSHQYYVRVKEESKGWVLIDAKIDAANITNKTKGEIFLEGLPDWATPKISPVWCDGFLRGVGSSPNYPTTMDILTTGELTVGFDWDKSTSWVSINHRYYVG